MTETGKGTQTEPRERRGRRGRGTGRRMPDKPCLNCGDTTVGNYCPNCGQAKRDVAVSVGALVADVLEDQLILNRALPHTLFALIFRPGYLTVEYINGRIVRFIAPFRLYLASSVIFFLLLSFIGLRQLDRITEQSGPAVQHAKDSVSVVLEARRDSLAALDTAAMPPAARRQVAAAAEQLRQLSERLDTAAVRRATENAASASIASAEDATSAGNVQPWARSLTVNMGSERLDSLFKQHTIARYGHLQPMDAARAFVRDFIQYLPQMMFVLLPVFALILKGLYIRRRRFYAEHFVFALHSHAFIFLMFTLILLIRQSAVTGALWLWILVYLWLAMRRVYGQGFLRTTLKYGMLACSYMLLLTFGLVGTLVVTVLL